MILLLSFEMKVQNNFGKQEKEIDDVRRKSGEFHRHGLFW